MTVHITIYRTDHIKALSDAHLLLTGSALVSQLMASTSA